MTPPPPYSEGSARFLDPDVTTTAASLKTLISKRDATFAKLIVTVILRNLECLKFQTTRPLAWSYENAAKDTGKSLATPGVDEILGFRAYDWRSRYLEIANLAKTDLTRRGFQVVFVNMFESTEINESGYGIILEWSVSPV